jgi:hypothetical protein
MTRMDTFAGGLGTGAVLISLAAAVLVWRAGAVDRLWGESSEERIRRSLERAQRQARQSADFLDACRAAGL